MKTHYPIINTPLNNIGWAVRSFKFPSTSGSAHFLAAPVINTYYSLDSRLCSCFLLSRLEQLSQWLHMMLCDVLLDWVDDIVHQMLCHILPQSVCSPQQLMSYT